MYRRLAICTAAALFLMTFGVMASPREHTTYLTFNQSVAIPGATLTPGTYIFEEADPTTSSDVVRVLSRDLGRTWPISVRMRKKSECLGVEKETTCRRRRYCSQQIAATEEPHRRIYVGRAEMTRPRYRPRRGATAFFARARLCLLQRGDLHESGRGGRWRGTIRRAYGRKTCVRRALLGPARLQWAGLREDGQPCPRRTADKSCAEASKDFTPG